MTIKELFIILSSFFGLISSSIAMLYVIDLIAKYGYIQ